MISEMWSFEENKVKSSFLVEVCSFLVLAGDDDKVDVVVDSEEVRERHQEDVEQAESGISVQHLRLRVSI